MIPVVMRGHSHSKNGVASLAYAPRIHRKINRPFLDDGLPGQARQ
jgi:hypothetical protein